MNFYPPGALQLHLLGMSTTRFHHPSVVALQLSREYLSEINKHP